MYRIRVYFKTEKELDKIIELLQGFHYNRDMTSVNFNDNPYVWINVQKRYYHINSGRGPTTIPEIQYSSLNHLKVALVNLALGLEP